MYILDNVFHSCGSHLACDAWFIHTLTFKLEDQNHNLILRGGPFDMWGAMVFLWDQTFFFTNSLNEQFFSDLIKSKQFFSQRSNSKQFCSPFISFDSPHKFSRSHLPGLFTMFFIRKAIV